MAHLSSAFLSLTTEGGLLFTEYDLRGNRTAVVDALQNRTTFAYDLGNRLTGITYPDATSVSFAYDTRAGGRRSLTRTGKSPRMPMTTPTVSSLLPAPR